MLFVTLQELRHGVNSRQEWLVGLSIYVGSTGKYIIICYLLLHHGRLWSLLYHSYSNETSPKVVNFG